MSSSEKKTASFGFGFLWAVMAGLMAWGALVAVGAYLGPEFWGQHEPSNRSASTEDQRPEGFNRPFDWRKPVIVAACVGGFLGTWVLLLGLRQRRLAREARESLERQAAGKLADAAQDSAVKPPH